MVLFLPKYPSNQNFCLQPGRNEGTVLQAFVVDKEIASVMKSELCELISKHIYNADFVSGLIIWNTFAEQIC